MGLHWHVVSKRLILVNAGGACPGDAAASMMEDVMRNEGVLDRSLRVVLGLGLLALVFVGPQTPLGWFGLVPLLTGAVGFCPLYRMIGINTCRL